MKIIKKINTSAVLALDEAGHEVVIMGKGVGFPPVPYELEDLTKIDRTFYDIDPKYFSMVGELPRPVILASVAIAELAEIELACDLNPNLPITLADHLNFSIERFKKELAVRTPLACDVKQLYPKEYALGIRALEILYQHTGVLLPSGDAVGVALHIINAETDTGNIHSTTGTPKIIEDVGDILENMLGITLDKENFYYARFTMHLRYLIQRLSEGKQIDAKLDMILRQMSLEYPSAYHCAKEVSEYLRDNYGWRCDDEKVVYLLVHINRMKEQLNR